MFKVGILCMLSPSGGRAVVGGGRKFRRLNVFYLAIVLLTVDRKLKSSALDGSWDGVDLPRLQWHARPGHMKYGGFDADSPFSFSFFL